MAKNPTNNPGNDTSSNPEILRDRLNELIAQVQEIKGAQAARLDAMEAHIGALCKQWDEKIAEIAGQSERMNKDLDGYQKGLVVFGDRLAATEKTGHGAALRDAFSGIAKPLLATMVSLKQLREITGHMADPALDALIADAKRS